MGLDYSMALVWILADLGTKESSEMAALCHNCGLVGDG